MLSLETERQIRREWALRAERMQPAPQQHPPFHPDYGLPQAYRLQVLRTAEQTSPAQAAEMHNVGISSIYRWRKAINEHLCTG
jgi:hypothetical protein